MYLDSCPELCAEDCEQCVQLGIELNEMEAEQNREEEEKEFHDTVFLEAQRDYDEFEREQERYEAQHGGEWEYLAGDY